MKKRLFCFLSCQRSSTRSPWERRVLNCAYWRCRHPPTTRLHFRFRRSFSQCLPSCLAPPLPVRAGKDSEDSQEDKISFQNNIKKLYSRRLNATEDEIRLLFIVPSEDNESMIEVLLINTGLEYAPKYHALSYTHGSPVPPKPLRPDENLPPNNSFDEKKITVVNGIECPVPLNLFHALRRFRSLRLNRPLWVDSICINQSDPVELSHQVRKMGEIYRHADEVLIWLGEAENEVETKMALKLINDLFHSFINWYHGAENADSCEQWDHIIQVIKASLDSKYESKYWNWLRSHCEAWADGLDLRQVCGRSDHRPWLAVVAILSRTWFDRVWTWQEKELAQKATVIIGATFLPWAELRFSMLAVMAHDLSDSRATPFQVMPAQQYLRVLDSLNFQDSPDLLDLVINVRHRGSHLERDKIFAVLGLAPSNSKDVKHFSEMINYGNLSTYELFKEFARYWIQDKRDLRVLQACTPARTRIPGLPTWAADWSDATPPNQLSTHLYHAAKDTQAVVNYKYESPDEIYLRGVSIDKVQTICQDSRLDNFERNFLNESARWDYFRDQLVSPFAVMYVAGTHPAHMSSPPKSHWLQAMTQVQWDGVYPPTGQTMAEAYWRTLLEDHSPHAKFNPDQRIPKDINISAIFDLWAQRQALARGHRPNSQTNLDNQLTPRWLERLQAAVKYNRFFVTEKGFIGMAPSNAQPGDIVCVFLGGHVPFCIRQVQDHFLLVEETYLHGFMDGKAIDMADCGELDMEDFRIR